MNKEHSTIERVLISRQEVMHMLGISSTTLHRVRNRDSTFPKPIKDGPHRQVHAYFVKAEVEACIKSKADSRPQLRPSRDAS